VSLSIGTVPAAPSAHGPAANAAAAKGSGLPFDAILDEQSDANDGEAGEVCDADLPVDRPATPAIGGGTNQTAIDPLTGALRGFAGGIRRFLVGKDEINPEAALLRAIGKDKPADEAATLLLLAVQDIVQRLESLEAPQAIGRAKPGESQTAAALAVDDQMAPNALPALVEATVTSADAATDASSVVSSTFAADLLTTDSSPADHSDPTRTLDMPFSRLAVPPAAALVDAIRLATGQGAFADQDRGFNEPSTTMGFDRRNSKGTAVPAIHLTEPTSVVDSAVKSFTPQGATAAPLPNEAAVISSIVQAMRLQMREGVGTAVVHLEPDYLGAVSIALRVENGVVTASLHAENPQVRAWMEANESQLRDALAGQGLSLDRLLVTDERIGDERSPNRRHQQEQEQQARQRPRRDDATTFEVVV
jgi:flagellar hook-length control protein FliK